VFTTDEYQQKAAELWASFTPNERALVEIGIFPAEKMDAVEAQGYKTYPLVVALMDTNATFRTAMTTRTGDDR
jgi:hypothetical protein